MVAQHSQNPFYYFDSRLFIYSLDHCLFGLSSTPPQLNPAQSTSIQLGELLLPFPTCSLNSAH